MIAVSFTRDEARWVTIAAGFVAGHFERLVSAGRLAALPTLPRLDDGETVLFWGEPLDVEVLACLRSRLLDKAPEVAPEDRREAVRTVALSAWGKIASAVPAGGVR